MFTKFFGLQCYLGHWRWRCPARKLGFHWCPQFCRCCMPTLGKDGHINGTRHYQEVCPCTKYCACLGS